MSQPSSTTSAPTSSSTGAPSTSAYGIQQGKRTITGCAPSATAAPTSSCSPSPSSAKPATRTSPRSGFLNSGTMPLVCPSFLLAQSLICGTTSSFSWTILARFRFPWLRYLLKTLLYCLSAASRRKHLGGKLLSLMNVGRRAEESNRRDGLHRVQLENAAEHQGCFRRGDQGGPPAPKAEAEEEEDAESVHHLVIWYQVKYMKWSGARRILK